ncbi:mitogen-activated protein kinase-binding protein 1-like isoform X1, partial [Clarias magur]
MEGSNIKTRIKNLLRSPHIKLPRSRRLDKEKPTSKLTLERVLGITTTGSSGLTCDPYSGIVAYPAGCVVVLLNPTKNQQQHIINTSRKTITALAFSSDGKYLVTGECGHLPAVRVWDVADGSQVAELQEHKYGVACVAFSPNGKCIVSIGSQHDMSVNVWAWKKNILVAANKVSSKVTAVSFSEDSSYFVTAGNRHVRYWYLEPCNSNKQLTAPVPLLGRSGLLGELQNNSFCDVACGRGEKSESIFCITSSGLLCEFNDKRMLDKWVDLRTSTASALFVTEELIFCACADGTVRVFNPSDLRFICTLPRPHHLGTDISAVTQASHLFANKPDARYPDSVAVTYDPAHFWLSCVYNDHSLYVWDVQDLQRVGKVYSGLYHSACVWDVQTFPEAKEEPLTGLTSSGLFFSCSADSTVRMWRTEPHVNPADSNLLSNDLQKVIYTTSNSAFLLDTEGSGTSSMEKPEEQPAESRTGIRSICVSPGGKHLASGDRNGTLRIHELNTMDELLKAEVHDSEILCLEYSKPETGMKLLVTAGRDRLIHVLDVEEDYSLLQTLDEHSSSITAVRFAANDGKVRMISCGADKSVYFRTAHKVLGKVQFKRTHHVVRKRTCHDLVVDPDCKYAVVGCQDRNLRVFNISSGKQKNSFKGSQAVDGSLLRVQMDPSGMYVATSCSDKNLSLFDFRTGECLAAMFGHSEIITSIKFTNDCRHLISASGDSCIFIWRLAPELTVNMTERLDRVTRCQRGPAFADSLIRRASTSSLEMHSTLSLLTCSSESEEDDDEETFADLQTEDDDVHQISLEEDQGAFDDAIDWDSSKFQESATGSCVSETSLSEVPHRRNRWNCRMGSLELMMKSMMELRQFDSFPKRGSALSDPTAPLSNQACGTASSMHKDTKRSKKRQTRPDLSSWSGSASSPEPEGMVLNSELYPSTGNFPGAYQEQLEKGQSQESHSPDRGSSMGYISGGSSSEQGNEGSDDPEPVSTDEEEDEGAARILPYFKPKIPEQKGFFKTRFETMGDPNTMGNEPKSQSRFSASFLAPGSTSRRHSDFLSRTDKKLKKCTGFKPLVSTVHPLQKDNGQGMNLEQRADTCSSERLYTTPKRRKTCTVHNVTSPISMSRLDSPVDKPLLKSISALSLTPNSRKCPHLRQTSRPSTPERYTDACDSTSRHPAATDPPSAQLWESPNTIRRLKVRSYMSPTTSSRAKVSRSLSLKEGLHQNLSGSSPNSPPRASIPLLPSLSAPLPGLSNTTETRLSQGGCPLNPTAKIIKSCVSARMSNPLTEYPRRSTPTPGTDSAAVTSTFVKTGVQHEDKCYTKVQVEAVKSVLPQSMFVKHSLGPETSSHTLQHPLVDVTGKKQSDQ